MLKRQSRADLGDDHLNSLLPDVQVDRRGFIAAALDYAARGRRGMNFHDARGILTRAYPYSELRDDALRQQLEPALAAHEQARARRPDRHVRRDRSSEYQALASFRQIARRSGTD